MTAQLMYTIQQRTVLTISFLPPDIQQQHQRL